MKRLVRFGGAAAAAAAMMSMGACGSDSNGGSAAMQGSECPVGSEGCDCTQGGACDPGLECRSNLCVDTGGAGGPGGGNGNGSGSSNNGSGNNGTGSGASNGSGGTTDAAPPTSDSCMANADCDAGQICIFDDPMTGRCIDGSGSDCASADTCIDDQGYDFHLGGVEGPFCEVSEDCVTMGGHVQGVCADAGGGDRYCVPLCQYHDDPGRFSCARDPQFGLIEDCSREHIRVLTTLGYYVFCILGERITEFVCEEPGFSPSADLDWTLSCMEDAIDAGSCTRINNCLSDSPFSPDPDARLSQSGFFDAIGSAVAFNTESAGGGGGGSSQCSTDCDCGRCGYCESIGGDGVCRYGGEGPYGCYRGCN